MNKRHYEHTLPNIRGSLSNTYFSPGLSGARMRTAGLLRTIPSYGFVHHKPLYKRPLSRPFPPSVLHLLHMSRNLYPLPANRSPCTRPGSPRTLSSRNVPLCFLAARQTEVVRTLSRACVQPGTLHPPVKRNAPPSVPDACNLVPSWLRRPGLPP